MSGRRIAAMLMLGAGVLIAGVSGLCSLVFLPEVLDGGNDYALAMGNMMLIFGLVPFLIGCGLVLAGRALLRREAADQSETEGDAR